MGCKILIVYLVEFVIVIFVVFVDFDLELVGEGIKVNYIYDICVDCIGIIKLLVEMFVVGL